MDKDYWLILLEKAVKDEGSQTAVSRKLGYSAAVVNQALKGKYTGDVKRLGEKIVEVYGNESVECPVLGTISLSHCRKTQKKEFSTANPMAVELWATCPICEHNYRVKG